MLFIGDQVAVRLLKSIEANFVGAVEYTDGIFVER